MNSFADELKKGCIEFEVITVISSRNHDYLWYYIGEFDDIMLISDLMRWLRVDLFFERSKRFIRWFIRLLPLRKINEELWFFTFLLSFVSSNKLARQGFTDANRSIPDRKTGTEPSSQKDGPSMCFGFLYRFFGLVLG